MYFHSVLLHYTHPLWNTVMAILEPSQKMLFVIFLRHFILICQNGTSQSWRTMLLIADLGSANWTWVGIESLMFQRKYSNQCWTSPVLTFQVGICHEYWSLILYKSYLSLSNVVVKPSPHKLLYVFLTLHFWLRCYVWEALSGSVWNIW